MPPTRLEEALHCAPADIFTRDFRMHGPSTESRDPIPFRCPFSRPVLEEEDLGTTSRVLTWGFV